MKELLLAPKSKVKEVIDMYILSILDNEDGVGKADLHIRLKFINYLASNYTNTNEPIDSVAVYKHFAKKVLGVDV